MKKISLCHYRCFENLHLEFSEKTTLLIGDNASGKTTVIRAIGAALGSFFTGFSDENTRFHGLSQEDFRIVRAEGGLANEEPVQIEFEWLGTRSTLQLNTPKGATLKTPLRPIAALGRELFKNLFKDGRQVRALPLFTSFSTADIHKPRRFNKDIFKKYVHKPSFGYFECLQGDGFLKYWTGRLLALQEGQTGTLEIGGVLKALADALGADGCQVIEKAEIRPIQGKVYYTLSDGRVVDTDNLSDGQKRLVNLVVDLGFRCMLLNKGIFGLEACTLTEGTVLIDEIDLHLHPSLQSRVVKGLQHAFPNLQFIITSHAPMVMTGIPLDHGNKTIQLGFDALKGYTAKEIQAYGMDVSTIIQAVMGVVPRSAEVENRLATLFELIDLGEYGKAVDKLSQMRGQFGEHLPELSKAEAMLNFLNEAEA